LRNPLAHQVDRTMAILQPDQNAASMAASCVFTLFAAMVPSGRNRRSRK